MDGAIASLKRWSILGVLGLGFLIRLARIDSRGLTYDDTFSIFLSARPLPDIIRGTAADTMPPLYYFLLHYWLAIGQLVWFIRLLSLFFSLLAIYLLYLWMRELTSDHRSAIFGALLMAVSPLQYYHAQDVRNYALLICAQLGYMFFFTRVWKDEIRQSHSSWLDWAGVAICAIIAMYTHNVAVLGLILPNFFLLVKRKWKLQLRLIFTQLIVGIVSLPWIIQLPGQIAKIERAWWLWRPGFIDILHIPLVWTTGLPVSGIWLSVGVLIGFEIFVLVFLGVWHNREEKDVIHLLLIVCVGMPVIFFALSYFMRPIFVPRGFLLASAAFLGLAGWVIQQGWRNGTGKLLLGGFLVASLVGLPAQANFDLFPRSPFEQAGQDLQKDVQPGEVIVHDNKLSFFPTHFYFPKLSQKFIADIPGSGNDTYAPASQAAMRLFPDPDLQSAVAGSSGIYFIVFDQAIQDYRALGEVDHPALAWLNTHFILASQKKYNDLEVYHYVRP
jgi:mannosyltransferase